MWKEQLLLSEENRMDGKDIYYFKILSFLFHKFKCQLKT